MLKEKQKKDRAPRPSVSRMLESIVGCKWSVSVLRAVAAGVHRPGALERAIPGISTKMLNERLRKLVRFGILERRVFPETPPRVEYHFTPFGRRFLPLIDQVEALERELGVETRASAPGAAGRAAAR